MKTHRTLGILWLAFCIYNTIKMVWFLSQVVGVPTFRPQPDFFVALLLCLVSLFAVVASIFLIRGAKWARIFIGLFALLILLVSVVQVVQGRPFTLLDGIGAIFALVSVVLLFLPRHEPVA
jgi:hypothetical protein